MTIKEKEYRVAKGEDVTLICSFVPANPVINNLLLSWDVVGTPSVRQTKCTACVLGCLGGIQ